MEENTLKEKKERRQEENNKMKIIIIIKKKDFVARNTAPFKSVPNPKSIRR